MIPAAHTSYRFSTTLCADFFGALTWNSYALQVLEEKGNSKTTRRLESHSYLKQSEEISKTAK